MLGIIYLILCILVGRVISEPFLSYYKDDSEGRSLPEGVLWVAAYGTGTLFLTWLVYLLAWFFHGVGNSRPLLFANVIVMGSSLLGLVCVYLKHRASCRIFISKKAEKKCSKKEMLFFLLLLAFVTFTMFYVFHVKDGVLYSGYTVYGDYAPHTAMIRSFSKGNNYPTQYPHFGGEDVKYHFMFQFYTGNLEYLGLRIDWAYNIPSILSLMGFLMMLYFLTKRITGKFAAGVLAVVLFFFRSALTFFKFVWNHYHIGDLKNALLQNTSFIGYTPNEDWGLWNYNVYLNQRHLAFGLLLVSVVLWIYLEWIKSSTAHTETGVVWLKNRFFTWKAWKSNNLEAALATGLVLGLCAFWNGAAVIGGLLILCGFAVFSDGKLDYAVTAAITIVFSVLQSKVFMTGSSMSAAFQWGFLAEDKSLGGVLWYLLQMSGVFFVGAVLMLLAYKREKRVLVAAMLFPVLFAFTMSLTPDIAVNHKYIMIAYAFLTIFWADVLVKIWKKNILTKVAAVILFICLTLTGIYDFVIIIRNNGNGRRIGVNLESDVTQWMVDNLDERDLILTAQYSMNDVTMSGKMLYSGWPYYAWSAGYDTYHRAEQAVTIFTSADQQVIRSIIEEEGITHIIFEDGIEYEQQICREDIIQKMYPVVYHSQDRRIRIYEVQ